jgi:hypothetical protein
MSKGFWLSDHDGAACERFVVGETVFVTGRGLRPMTPYEFELLPAGAGDKPDLIARYTTDRHGALPIAVLLTHVGFAHGKEPGVRTLHELLKPHTSQERDIRTARWNADDAEHQTIRLTVTAPGRKPRLFACDPEGRLQPGFEQGAGHAAVAFCNFPAGCIRVFVVPRQFNWRIGDPIELAATRGAPAVSPKNCDAPQQRRPASGQLPVHRAGVSTRLVRSRRTEPPRR